MLKSGDIVLADDFEIVQPKRKKPRSLWLFALCVLIIVIAGLWYQYRSSRPLIQVILSSRKLVSVRVLPGMPAFLDNETLVFAQHDEGGGSRLVFRKLSEFSEETYAKSYVSAEYMHPSFVSEKRILAFTMRQYDIPKVVVVPADGPASVLTYGSWPSLSRDGKKVVFQKSTDTSDEIWIMGGDGLEQNSANLSGRHPEWSPKRDEFVFESADATGISSIKLTDAKKMETKTLTKSAKARSEGGRFSPMYPSFSPDGKLIIFFKEGDGLWAMRRNGERQERILRVSRTSEVMMGRISPDGRYLVVWSGTALKSQGEGKLYLFEIKYKKLHPPRQKIDVEKLVTLIESVSKLEEEKRELAQIEGSSVGENETYPLSSLGASEATYGYLKIKEVKPESGVRIYIDDEIVATTPISDAIPIKVGRHSIKLENPQTGTLWEEYRDFQANETYSLPEIDLR